MRTFSAVYPKKKTYYTTYLANNQKRKGLWRIDHITVEDEVGNETDYYNKALYKKTGKKYVDFSKGNFRIK